jgi:pimeloyl-ACP methyl ester carboxylesterase
VKNSFKFCVAKEGGSNVLVNSISLHVEDHGSGKPVVLLHGWPDSSYPWRNQIPFLVANGFRAVAPDQRGFGGSDRPEAVAACSLENVVADVAGILDALGTETADIVGHYWGAAVAWFTATDYPNRIHMLVVLSVEHPLAPRTLRQREMGWNQLLFQFERIAEASLHHDNWDRSGNRSEAMVISIVTSRICHGPTLPWPARMQLAGCIIR